VFLRRDLSAIIALGATGLAIALLMVLEPAPDVALVQIVVDILAVVILTLALIRIPREQRQAAQMYSLDEPSSGMLRDGVVAIAAGLFAAGLTIVALTTRPRFSAPTPFYEANAKALAGAKDIVGAIVVDFRAFDTLVEIAVFGLAGLGIYALLRYAAKRATRAQWQTVEGDQDTTWLSTRGIGGGETSSFLHALAYLSLPVSMLIAIVHILYGHDQPGDGFTAGVIISLAIGFWYVIFGFEGVKQRLAWLRPHRLIASGLLLALATATSAQLIVGAFFSHVDYGVLLGIQLPEGVNFSSALLFELSICLSVLGSGSLILDTLGHPQDDPGDEYQVRRQDD
jgi:multicomponent K+:H+ antiporter subunit A